MAALGWFDCRLFLVPSEKRNGDQKGWPQFLGLLVEVAIAVVMFVPGVLIAVVSIDIRTILFCSDTTSCLARFFDTAIRSTCLAKIRVSKHRELALPA